MWRSLIHYRRVHLAVILAAAVTTAVLTGSLLVGDSVRGSLAELVLGRLGGIEHAVVSTGFFREELAADLEGNAAFRDGYRSAAPVILVTGGAIHAAGGRRASQVRLHGIGSGFLNTYGSDAAGIASLRQITEGASSGPFPPVAINESLGRELQAKIGDQILMKFEQHADIPQESLLGERDAVDTVRTLRLTIAQIMPDSGPGRFGLDPGQLLPLNAFVSLPVLQRALGQKGRVNAVLTAGSSEPAVPLPRIVSQEWTLGDAGLSLRNTGAGVLSVESRDIFLNDAMASAIAAAGAGLRQQELLVYIANSIEAGGNSVPYSTVAAIPFPADAAFGAFTFTDGPPVASMQSQEVLVNRWTAEDLGVLRGDRITLKYFVPGPGNELLTQASEFRVAGVVEMTGPGADPLLAPDFPGIHEANMADWDVPFPVDLNRIRSTDEDYWDAHGAAPKVFVTIEDGRRLWGSRYGSRTSIRFASTDSAQQVRARVERALLQSLRPEEAGFVFQAVRERGLQAAQGSTDFSGLFIGFSLFLIVSAGLLTALLFRLGAELRAPEIGLLLAVGYPERSVQRRLLREGLALAAAGAVLGTAGAVGYTAAMLAGLRTWWSDAIGTSFLELHVSASSLVAGALLSLALVALALWRSVRRLAQIPAPSLLAGGASITNTVDASPRLRIAARILPAIAVVLIAAAVARPGAAAPLFFAAGSLLLSGGLCAFRLWMLGVRRSLPAGIGALALRNSVWNPARSILSAALVCTASFVIVAVGANRRNLQGEALRKDSGTGGFTLVAQSDIPLIRPLESSGSLQEFGLAGAAPGALHSFRYLPGEDASCLNLYRPEKPRLLGVPQSLIDRGGFAFTKTIIASAAPWSLLNNDLGPGVIPAFGDANSVQWILHSGLGQDIEMLDDRGRPLKLRLVGLLEHSIFQSELLISEENFRKYYADRNGYSYFLVETPPEKIHETETALETSLADFGFDAVRTADRLARFHAVENTYIAVFQALGGLGLMLGTLGLAVVLLRNVAERRRELATMMAFGFRRSRIAGMIWLESAFLLCVGLALGVGSALIAVAPQLVAHPLQVPWASLLQTLGVVFATGALAGALAARATLRSPLLPALKGE